MLAPKWTEDRIPDQTGRTALITGANSGLGLRSAEVLAAKGARVLLACRSAERGERALRTVGAVATGAEPELVRLDLADLESVRLAASSARRLSGDALHILINNAGLLPGSEGRTADGFELAFGTNHLGHAALTWLLMPALRGAGHARVVALSSVAAVAARGELTDLGFEHRRYRPDLAYGRSKLATQVFALELDRRLRAADEPVLSVVSQPGYVATGLVQALAYSLGNPVLGAAMKVAGRLGDLLIAQDVRAGALPQLCAATDDAINGGDYLGPDRLRGLRGHPAVHPPLAAALDQRLGTELWELTAKLTGVTPDPR
ncbi:oxidoreductase [Amycolatopsis nigrescens]|uniref:oxidoreductase n=1 Tax=Amycolatopsis nigrescens TaxID=381445 RepID=UPI00036FB817|nr:oxidoreductase [Amycolatopsis nigrescens]